MSSSSSSSSQTILAIDKEGKITLWNKHDYDDDDDEYYENSQLAKIFNERGQVFTYACFSPSINNGSSSSSSQTILAIDKEGKIHRLIERIYHDDNKRISYFENIFLKSTGDRIFTHVTTSFDSQTILAIDEEGKITLWNKNDYDDDDDEYYENSQLAKIFNERGQVFTYACFSPDAQKNLIATEIKDKKDLVLWKIDKNSKDIECKHIFHLDSISFIGSTSFSSDSNNLICLNKGMLYRLSIKNAEDNKVKKLIHFDHYFFSRSTRSLDEDNESTNNIKNIIKENSNDISNHQDKKASDNYYKIITKYSDYLSFNEIKELILKSGSIYKDLSVYR